MTCCCATHENNVSFGPKSVSPDSPELFHRETSLKEYSARVVLLIGKSQASGSRAQVLLFKRSSSPLPCIFVERLGRHKQTDLSLQFEKIFVEGHSDRDIERCPDDQQLLFNEVNSYVRSKKPPIDN